MYCTLVGVPLCMYCTLVGDNVGLDVGTKSACLSSTLFVIHVVCSPLCLSSTLVQTQASSHTLCGVLLDVHTLLQPGHTIPQAAATAGTAVLSITTCIYQPVKRRVYKSSNYTRPIGSFGEDKDNASHPQAVPSLVSVSHQDLDKPKPMPFSFSELQGFRVEILA